MLDIGTRLELFVDRLLVETLDGVDFQMHRPRPTPLPESPLCGGYTNVIKEGELYRAWYNRINPSSTSKLKGMDGNEEYLICYAESSDGIEWNMPDICLFTVEGDNHKNAVLTTPPFTHNLSPFLDTNPQASPDSRYKALAGQHPLSVLPGSGLHAFQSPDGIHWEMMQEQAVIIPPEFGLDSNNVSFWSTEEECYVCYFRTFLKPSGDSIPGWATAETIASWPPAWTEMTEDEIQSQRDNWKHPVPGQFRNISRTTSKDYIHWTNPVMMEANLPGEHLYTSGTHPYFRAPHIYVALPTRLNEDCGCSTDILFMSTRAGSSHYDRLFTEAFIRPGLDPQRWGNRSNYVACGVVPTSPTEMSIYHHKSGVRYTLRTDGFTSIHAGAIKGRMITRPFIFNGSSLTLNLSTSTVGGMRVELQDEEGHPLPGHALDDCPPIFADTIEHTVNWQNGSDVSAWAGKPVRLQFELQDADLYAIQFK